MSVSSADGLRVGILGWGTIGQTLAHQIEAQTATGDRSLVLSAVTSRFTDGTPHALAVPAGDLAGHCDVVVEAAGPDAVRDHAESCLAGGVDVVLLSLGALADDHLRSTLINAGPGRLVLCSGAIGGVDMIEAARLHGEVHKILIETTKPAAVLERDWMTDEFRATLRSSTAPVECFRGSVAEAVTRFPESLNVSAALAMAAGRFDVVEVVVIGSPTATGNVHTISVEADSGSYRFSVTNTPSPDNPKTSHVTAWAALRSLRSLAGAPGVFA